MLSEIEYLDSFISVKPKLGIHGIIKLINKLGYHQDKIKIIHIAGTNGKGSTGAIISSILQSTNKKVGLYTSPHLESFFERIKINNRNISKESIEKIIQKLRPYELLPKNWTRQ